MTHPSLDDVRRALKILRECNAGTNETVRAIGVVKDLAQSYLEVSEELPKEKELPKTPPYMIGSERMILPENKQKEK